MKISKQHKARLAAHHTVKMVAASGPVTIKAGAVEGDNTGPSSFEAVAYAGDRVPGRTLNPPIKGDYIIDLSGMAQGKKPKANLDHKPTQRVGHLTDFQNDGKQVEVKGVLSAATSFRDEVLKSANDGYEWEVSIEADLSKPQPLAAGKTATVNGRTVTGPILIFRKSVLSDLGFVSRGASEGNQVNFNMALSAAGATQMNEFEKFAASLGVDLENSTDEQRAQLQAVYAKQHPNDHDAFALSVTEIAREQRAVLEHKNKINAIAKSAMQDFPMYIDQIEKLSTAALSSKVDPDKFELELIRATRSKAGTFQAQMSGTQNDPKVLEAALCMASGLPNIEKHFSERTLEAVDANRLRNISLHQVLLQAAQANGGYQCRAGERITTGNLRAVLKACFSEDTHQARLGFSTASLPNILGAVANKQILAGYMEEDQSWKEAAQVKSVSNFYTQNYFRMLDSLEYEEVGSSGELHHGTLGEETYTSQAKTYGKMLGLTRPQIINDDLGAFDDIRARLGRGAAKKFNDVFWAAFVDNSSFFTSGLTNYISGSTSNLGTDGVGLGLMVAAFRQMTTPSADGSKRVGQDINPTIILVPPELESNALMAYKNANLGYAAMGTGANIFAGRFRPVVQWRLSNSSYTGYSTTAFYMFGDVIKPMLVTFLNGNQTPIVESSDADFDTLGILFRGYHDFSAGKSEYLAGVKSKGAS